MTHIAKSEQDTSPCRMPKTTTGWCSLWLGASFAIPFALWLAYIGFSAPMSRPTFFSDPTHAVLIFAAAIAAIGGAAIGAFSVAMRRERSVMVFASIVLGALVLYWAVAEVVSH